ncbi:MAG: hypothetical protein ACYC3I_24960 [Gemmataceae bacterium]
MPRRTPRSKAIPPLFLLRAGERCPQCSEGTNVFAQLASGLYDGGEEGIFDDFILLKNIKYLPKRFLLPVEIQVRVVSGWSSGGLTDWLDYDQAKSWEALAAAA